MKRYKAFNKGLTCRGYKFEVGQTYKHDGKIGLCEAGFHFCVKPADCATYYNHANSEFAEIEAIGKVIEGDNKCVTDEIKIVRLIDKSEFYQMANYGKDNVGIRNTGDRNTGDSNTGDSNTGFWNTGNSNTGDSNTGYGNTGGSNTGNSNTGDRNTGYWNTGDSNTGFWNCTNHATGFFCTEEQTVKLFDIDTGMTRGQLVEVLPGILFGIPFGNYWQDHQLHTYTAEDRQKFYDSLSNADQKRIKSIPHFDADKFKKCTGIEV